MSPPSHKADSYLGSLRSLWPPISRLRLGTSSVQPSTDTVPEIIEEVEKHGDDDQGECNDGEDRDIAVATPYGVVREIPTDMEVQNVQPSTGTIPEKARLRS